MEFKINKWQVVIFVILILLFSYFYYAGYRAEKDYWGDRHLLNTVNSSNYSEVTFDQPYNFSVPSQATYTFFDNAVFMIGWNASIPQDPWIQMENSTVPTLIKIGIDSTFQNIAEPEIIYKFDASDAEENLNIHQLTSLYTPDGENFYLLENSPSNKDHIGQLYKFSSSGVHDNLTLPKYSEIIGEETIDLYYRDNNLIKMQDNKLYFNSYLRIITGNSDTVEYAKLIMFDLGDNSFDIIEQAQGIYDMVYYNEIMDLVYFSSGHSYRYSGGITGRTQAAISWHDLIDNRKLEIHSTYVYVGSSETNTTFPLKETNFRVVNQNIALHPIGTLLSTVSGFFVFQLQSHPVTMNIFEPKYNSVIILASILVLISNTLYDKSLRLLKIRE